MLDLLPPVLLRHELFMLDLLIFKLLAIELVISDFLLPDHPYLTSACPIASPLVPTLAN